jgi:hypothetical protein
MAAEFERFGLDEDRFRGPLSNELLNSSVKFSTTEKPRWFKNPVLMENLRRGLRAFRYELL